MLKGGGKSRAESPDRLNRLVAGSKLNGDLSTNSSLRLDGEVKGNVKCEGKFVLGEEGVVAGDVYATDVEVDGKITGQVVAENLLVLHKTAKIQGNILCKRLVIEDGANIDGNIQTGDVSNLVAEFIKQSETKETSDLVH